MCSAKIVQSGSVARPHNIAGIYPSLSVCLHILCDDMLHIHPSQRIVYDDLCIHVCTSAVHLRHIMARSWIPDFWKVVSWIFPSTFGINGFVRINSMGATLSDVLPEFRALWIHTGIYFITTCIVYRRQIQISHRHVEEKLKKARKYFRLKKKENIMA